jgi:phosphoglycerol transferase MdoB-like AlkP superfamily enzyme
MPLFAKRLSSRSTETLSSAPKHSLSHRDLIDYSPFPLWISKLINGILMPATFAMISSVSVILLQWGIASQNSHLADVLTWKNIIELFSQEKKTLLLATILVAFIYLVTISITNQFWIATPIVASFFIVFSIAERIKVRLRDEPVLPSDITLAGSNGGSLTKFVTPGDQLLICHGFIAILIIVCISVLLHSLLKYPRIITFRSQLLYLVTRSFFFLIPATLFFSFTMNLSVFNSWSYNLAKNMGDTPIMWLTKEDAESNGPFLSFLRYVNPNAMTTPENYSKATMERIASYYKKTTQRINSQRTSILTNNSIIMILSESYSDPTRVPDISFAEDPMPNIRKIKETTTAGLMLSSGYGGGTAGLEFQALTGLSTTNFNSSLVSPYQQLVPSMTWTPTFNQGWNKNSVAIHPFISSFYSRSTNYKKFGFKHFWTSEGSELMKYSEKIDRSGFVSDSATYTEALYRMSKKKDEAQFIQIATMQNHMPYDNWYDDNQFQVSSANGSSFSDWEKTSINTYAKGVSYTDSATKDFLDSLNKLQKPVTVIFYGDHLPGIYETASKDAKNSQALHETDYFIWSNSASSSAQTKLSSEESNYTSPNYLMAQAAEHTNSKVSPYLAFLTEMHTAIPAMEPAISASEAWSSPTANSGQLYLDSSGNKIDTSKLSAEQKSLLKDYKLIQYDITVGKNYLKDLGFMDLPGEKK